MRLKWIKGLLVATALVSLVGTTALAGHHTIEDSWKITSPTPGATVTGPDVTLTIDPGKVVVTKPGAKVSGEGHWHFFVDGKEVGKGPTNSFTYKGLAPGDHTLRVELAYGDHTRYPGNYFREVAIKVALPKTGLNLGLLSAVGLALLAAGLALVLRRPRLSQR